MVSNNETERLYLLTALVKEEKNFDTLVGAVKAAGTTVVKTENLGERTLAFPINKQRSLLLGSVFFTATGAQVKELEKELKTEEAIERFLLTDWKGDPDAPKRQPRTGRRDNDKERAHVQS